MAYYGHCESYFVEGHEGTERRYRDEIRERERFANQQIQYELGADLSKLTSYEYGPEILQEMEKVEVSIMFPDVVDVPNLTSTSGRYIT